MRGILLLAVFCNYFIQKWSCYICNILNCSEEVQYLLRWWLLRTCKSFVVVYTQSKTTSNGEMILHIAALMKSAEEQRAVLLVVSLQVFSIAHVVVSLIGSVGRGKPFCI